MTEESPKPMLEEVGPEFEPDWTMLGTAEYLEEQLGDFKFKGEGWYPSTYKADPESEKRAYRVGQVDWLVVFKLYIDPTGDIYKVAVYNGRDPRNNFQRVVTLPTIS